jgi:hypothetical protein
MEDLRRDGPGLRSLIRCECVLKKPQYFDHIGNLLDNLSSLAIGADAELNPINC